MRTLLVIFGSALAAACGANPEPSSTSQPESSARSLTGSEPEAMAIVIAAGKTIPADAQFSGVVIDGREVKPLSDSVARTYRLKRVPYQPVTGGKVPFAITCAPGSACPIGTSVPVAVLTYVFNGVSVRGDTAFVGVGSGTSRQAKECMSLALTNDRWIVAGTKYVPSFDRCP
jgi:hypothetical protein